jgi:aquaporin Z
MREQAWQRYLAELFGTFTYVFVGTVAVVGSGRLFQSPVGPQLVAPFAFGLALLAGLYAFAEISGGHFNPAVSLALYLDRRLSVVDLAGYWLFQFAGGVLASLIVLLAYNQDTVAGTATLPGTGTGDGGAVVLEVVFTAVLALVILQVTKSDTFNRSALVAIPLTLVALHFAGVPLTGLSVNPARSFGPALVGDKWTSLWIYFLAPAAGAILGWLVHTVVVSGDVDVRDNVAELAEEIESEMEGGGRAVSDSGPEPAAPEWGAEAKEEAGEGEEEGKT